MFFPGFLADGKQLAGAVHIGFNESLRLVDGAVHMGLGGEVDHAGHVFILKQVHQDLFVQDASLNEAVTLRIALGQILEISRVAGIGQGIQANQAPLGTKAQGMANKIGTDEPGAAGDEIGRWCCVHTLIPTRCLPTKRGRLTLGMPLPGRVNDFFDAFYTWPPV